MTAVVPEHAFPRVVHLAAQAGVRYSLKNPHAYVDSNVTGFLNILEGCRHHACEHLVFASSSSVYGANRKLPFSEHDHTDHPVSLYAATKKANELMAHTYSHLFGLPTTGLRFFTVYGPWGRPDMSAFLFTRAILEGRPIDVFNHGEMERDFTYVDDIVEGVVRVLDVIPSSDPASRHGASRPRPQHGAVPALQHRQPPAGSAAAVHRNARAGPGPQGGQEPACRCSPAMCAPRLPTSTICAPRSGSRRRRR